MQLTLYTDYALRVLVHLASRESEVVTVQDVANALGVSRNHLVKVVHHLGLMGLIHSVRGKGGGIALARPAEEISMAEVVRLMEKNLDLLECFHNEDYNCRANGACNLKSALRIAQDSFFAALGRFTLRDLLRPAAYWHEMSHSEPGLAPVAAPLLPESIVFFPRRNSLGGN